MLESVRHEKLLNVPNVLTMLHLLMVPLLVVLFLGSSTFAEEISSGKYPGYERYQQEAPRFLPVRIKNQRPL